MAQPKLDEAHVRYTPAEYLALERASATRHEYFDGQIYAMAGASRRHNLITANVLRELGNLLRRKPCEVYTSDMRVKVAESGLYTYPDVVIACGEPRFEDEEEVDTLLNPTLLVEVLSKTTADYDRGAKFDDYRTIPSLQEVLFVAQSRVHVVDYTRQADGTWILFETEDPAARLPLSSLAVELSVEEVYAKVPFKA